ncbi:MAG TPA: Hpt domain-containing protein, partial [Acetobacteraceae bacterium]|nr:Hpt domain-containing protein [Acetobacteraceae bacterium]
MDDLIAEFLTETNESLAALDLALVRLERVPDDPDTLAMIFRLVHTIKGTCGFLALPRLETVAHAAETVLGRVRDGELSVTPEIVTLTLRAIDSIKAIIVGLRTSGAEPPGDDVGLIAALKCAAEGDPAASSGGHPAQPQAVSNLGAPPVAGGSSHKADRPGRGASELSLVPADIVQPGQTIRVAVHTLEHLMTLVSELVLTRNQLLQLARSQDANAWLAPLQLLSQLTTELQQGVMKTRMQPIGSAWNKLPRMVRDLGRELGKQIELDLNGGDTELDRQVLELIRDPLTHMVRNSADHGVEPPDERRLAGKPETGIISLNAFHRGGHIVVEVADDGRGISAEGIRAKALAQGLGSEAELAAMNEAQLHRFIFRAGFSTAAALTTVSGRGVGM